MPNPRDQIDFQKKGHRDEGGKQENRRGAQRGGMVKGGAGQARRGLFCFVYFVLQEKREIGASIERRQRKV